MAIAVACGLFPRAARAQDPGAQPPATEAPAVGAQDVPQVPVVPPAPAAPALWTPRYHTLEEVTVWARAWIDSGTAEALALPASRAGRAAPGLSFGAEGPLPLAQRPTIFLLGGLDGVSLSGCEAALRVADELLRARATLPPNLAFVAIPWAAPDGLARTLAGDPCDGRDLLPLDDDADLSIDEDGPDDADGDGQILEMLIEDPRGAWARGADARFLVPAKSGDRVRYARAKEGRDDDGDGRFNEDPVGGVVLDLAFPVGWQGEAGGLGGPLPLDDGLSRALADLLLARPRLACLVFQGNHGLVAHAGADTASPADEAVVRLFAESTTRPQRAPVTLAGARGELRPGAAIEWAHAVVGTLALEVAAWGPFQEAEGARGTTLDARSDARGTAATAAAPDTEGAWARWLDDVRGGIGFLDWHPVDLGDGRTLLVGGWLPFARANPPAESLEVATHGLAGFVRKLAAGAPSLELRLLESSRDGEVVTVRARLENTGKFPTGFGPDGARVELELPAGARLLWGEGEARLGVLGPGETSREVTAVALVPSGATLKLRAAAPWATRVEREVKP